jgi:hypothetical protein
MQQDVEGRLAFNFPIGMGSIQTDAGQFRFGRRVKQSAKPSHPFFLSNCIYTACLKPKIYVPNLERMRFRGNRNIFDP